MLAWPSLGTDPATNQHATQWQRARCAKALWRAPHTFTLCSVAARSGAALCTGTFNKQHQHHRVRGWYRWISPSTVNVTRKPKEVVPVVVYSVSLTVPFSSDKTKASRAVDWIHTPSSGLGLVGVWIQTAPLKAFVVAGKCYRLSWLPRAFPSGCDSAQ